MGRTDVEMWDGLTHTSVYQVGYADSMDDPRAVEEGTLPKRLLWKRSYRRRVLPHSLMNESIEFCIIHNQRHGPEVYFVSNRPAVMAIWIE
jgi:hypothetical protein